MLEQLVAGLIRRYLGPYVKNLNTDQLEVSLFKGSVELEDVEIRSDALDMLQLPLTVKAVRSQPIHHVLTTIIVLKRWFVLQYTWK